MKRVAIILFLVLLVLKLSAQDSTGKKPSTLVFHVFYNDFNTAQQIRTNSLSHTTWSSFSDMQMGFGFNYLKGIGTKIDLVSTLDASSADYLFKDGTTNGSSKLLLDANAGLNFKLFTDRHALVPYLFVGAGLSMYNSKLGSYIPLGLGVQVNLFNQAFVFSNMQYRRAITPAVNDHFQYNIGVGAAIGKKKKAKLSVIPIVVPEKVTEPVVSAVTAAPVTPAPVVKNVQVSVIDSLTGLPLPGAAVSIVGTSVQIKSVTDIKGAVSFNDVQAADYTVSGALNGINTAIKQITKDSFDIPGSDMKIALLHNDPRFTLTGQVNNKTTGKPEGGVTVNLTNITQNSNSGSESQSGNGAFNLQLQAGSDFTVSGKKAGYISNIEQVSTKGLNRSATLFVNLQLAVDEASPDKIITLKNVYYDSGSIKIKVNSVPELEKLILFLKDNPGTVIEIASHTDSRGSDAVNLKLSQARAQELVNYLAKNGIDKKRLIPKGYGETKIINGCVNGVKCTPAQHEQNRRTEFKVIRN
ncbi:MAG: OmpA family protein [Bacteroidota bacterium]